MGQRYVSRVSFCNRSNLSTAHIHWIQYNNDNVSDDKMMVGDGAVGRAFSRGDHFKISNILWVYGKKKSDLTPAMAENEDSACPKLLRRLCSRSKSRNWDLVWLGLTKRKVEKSSWIGPIGDTSDSGLPTYFIAFTFVLFDRHANHATCFCFLFLSSSSRQPGPSGGGQEQRQEGQGVHGFVAMEVVRVQ